VSDHLFELPVLALDCQAAGATPAHGDLLEIGWAVCSQAGISGEVHSQWIVPRTRRPIRRAVRELTGWSESCIEEAVDEGRAWTQLSEAFTMSPGVPAGTPTVIHFARFELPFLRELHGRHGRGTAFPFDVVCLHDIAVRLFPDLPRRNLRALAGYLGHAPTLSRRSAGHVEATAFIWSQLLPILGQTGIETWSALKLWLEQSRPSPRSKRRSFPLDPKQRRNLPDKPGVYRFIRKNGDVLYVGKAASLKKRVASHFKTRGPATERSLELLTQVHEISHTQTPSALEAALLESDDIKRFDPPYNVQLRTAERNAWFARRDLTEVVMKVDADHPIGPLPSKRALAGLAALIAMAEGADASPARMAAALVVPSAFLPDEPLFSEGWRAFSAGVAASPELSPARRLARASLALWRERRYSEPEAPTEDSEPTDWDLARVQRRLERSLVQGGLLIRRARWLCLLSEAIVAFRERGQCARALVIAQGSLSEAHELTQVDDIRRLSAQRPKSLGERRACFDANVYDRMRILLTELQRVRMDGGEIALRIGGHTYTTAELSEPMRSV